MVLNPHQPPSHPVSIEHLNLYRQFVNEVRAKVDKLNKEVEVIKQFHQSTVVQQDDSKNKARENPQQRAKLAMYANRIKKLCTGFSEAISAVRILKITMDAQCRKLSRTEKSLFANAITQLSSDNRKKASQSDYTLRGLYLIIKNRLQAQEGTNDITHEDDIEEKKNNAKRRKIV